MDCKNHPGFNASYACSICGKPICLHCTVELDNKAYCKECLEKHLSSVPVQPKPKVSGRKSKFLTFMLGCVPGAGHMYLGFIKKGISLMAIYFISLFTVLFIADAVHIDWLQPFFIPTLSILCFFYSIFDSLAMADQLNSGKIIEDTSLLGSTIELNLIKDRFLSRKKTIGYVLIFLGGLGILNIFIDIFENVLRRYLNMYLRFSITKLFAPVLLILLGIYLLRKSRHIIEM